MAHSFVKIMLVFRSLVGLSLLSSPGLAMFAQMADSLTLGSSVEQLGSGHDLEALGISSKLQHYFIPPKKKRPDHTESSATRNRLACEGDSQPFQVLASPGGYGLSLRERPAIAVQVPSSAAKSLSLIFRQEETEFYERVSFSLNAGVKNNRFVAEHHGSRAQKHDGSSSTEPLAQTADVSSRRSPTVARRQRVATIPGPAASDSTLHLLRLPPDAPTLQPQHAYHWSVVIHCEATVQPDDPVFSGWIEYRPTRPPQSLESERDRLQWYGARGYWYDMVEQLMPSKSSESQRPIQPQ